jgi:hypothetical protein
MILFLRLVKPPLFAVYADFADLPDPIESQQIRAFCWCRLSASLSPADNKPLISLASESGPNPKTPQPRRGHPGAV